ncbi:MAG TPA: redoxin family protein [Myxococcota bacterium]
MKAVLGVVAFVVFVGGLMAAAWYASQSQQPKKSARVDAPAAASATIDDNGAVASPSAEAGPEKNDKPVPLPDLVVFKDDKAPAPIELAGARQKPALLHLWASWCGPCRAELPSLLAFGKAHNVDVIAVSVDDHWPDVVRFFAGKIPSEVVWDKNIALERALGTDSIPDTFLVSTKGEVVDSFLGAQPWDSPDLQRGVSAELR